MSKARAIILSAGLALTFGFSSGVIEDFQRVYSVSPFYQKQVESFLMRRFSLSEAPEDLRFDLAWGEGVQQVWGLGVPLWMLPFSIVSRAFGDGPVPERICFIAALGMLCYLTLRIPLTPVQERDTLSSLMWAILPVLFLVFYPPFLNFCSGPFNVYEEVIAYAYIYAVALYYGLLMLFRKVTITRLAFLATGCGFGAFLRPTMLSYACVAFVLAIAIAWRAGISLLKIAVGSAPFVILLALLLETNSRRFGAPFEFGHKINLTAPELIIPSRFRNPFRGVPLHEAALELAGQLFFLKDSSNTSPFSSDIASGQSPTLRWRHFYHTTFPIAAALPPLILIALLCLKTTAKPIWRTLASAPEFAVGLVWAGGAFICLFSFYLYFPSISSRYLMDFAPSMAVGALLSSCVIMRSASSRWGRPPIMLITAVFASWWAFLYSPLKSVEPARGLTRAQAKARWIPRVGVYGLPSGYTLGVPLSEWTGYERNGEGWDTVTGETEAAVILYFPSCSSIRLTFKHSVTASVRENYSTIALKLGGESLRLTSVSLSGPNAIVTFARSRRSKTKPVEIGYLCLNPGDAYLRSKTAFRLLAVDWSGNQP